MNQSITRCTPGPVNLLVRYRPRTLTDLVGQGSAVGQLLSFLAAAETEPSAAALFLHGPPGVGKTAAAWALAGDLGCDTAEGELGGVYEVPSGKQDGAAVERLVESLHYRPLFGSGWKVAIINEADYMTRQAEVIWLDALESLPPLTVVVFTTNDLSRLSARLVSRCETVRFGGRREELGDAVAELVRRVWRAETGQELQRVPEDIGLFDLFSGTLSIRLALQQLTPYVRSRQPLPARFAAPMMREAGPDALTAQDYSTAAKKAAETRRRNQRKG
jgi:replication-associated recombination protein RarA